MANKYFVWKNGTPQDWEELTGTEFYALTKSDAAKGRYFTKITSDEEDAVLILESTKEVFDKNKQDRNRVTYLAERDEPYSITTFSAINDLDGNDEDISIEEKIADHGIGVEDLCHQRELLKAFKAFQSQLSEMEQEILQQGIFNVQRTKNHTSQIKLAEKYNVSRITIARTKQRLCELFVNNEKNMIQLMQKFSND